MESTKGGTTMNLLDFLNEPNPKFINQLKNIDSPFLLTTEQKQDLHKKLTQTKFVLDNSNYNLVYYNELFLISSLINNYEKTLSILDKIDPSKIKSEKGNNSKCKEC